MTVSKNTSFRSPWELTSLTPTYIETEHGGYVTAIEAALDNSEIRNIALSGNYGVGKSSILREVARRQNNRVVEISLSTLSPIEASALDDSVPKQATTPTNRIQQEIVKQLLYREEPGKTPGSRFRRIERFRWQSEVGTAALLGFLATVMFLLTGWTSLIASAIPFLKEIGALVHVLVYGVATGIALLVRWRLYGKLHIKQFSAGSATVTLNDNSVSYFDQYLDEIVYFFEVSDRNVVIFEDIDRFNDSHIFETLRALNSLLNASPQIEQPVRFIYAIKDSIFDSIALKEEGRKLDQSILDSNDPAIAEVVRANRTKFFDLIIPVVPFITHRSARNLAIQLLGKFEHEVASELIDLAAQYVPDMRLLKNIRNEFIVFRDRIFSGDGESLNLNKTDLFAMILYKNTHLTDFEHIRLARSRLDIIYRTSRELISTNIKQIEHSRSTLQQKIEDINGAAVRCEQLGERFLAYVKRTADALNYEFQSVSFSFDGYLVTVDELKEAAFWSDFCLADDNPVIYFRNHRGQSMNFSRDNLIVDLGDPLDAKLWDDAERETLYKGIEESKSSIRFLRSADLGDLIKHSEFVMAYGDNMQQPFSTIAQAILRSELAYQLIRAGYINRNFTLYTSTFHGTRVSPAATNFIIHHVERDLMDVYFELAPDDVDAIIRERGKEALKDSALYNINILDHLLSNDIGLADIMIYSLLISRDNSEIFVQAYLVTGEQRTLFIERFAEVNAEIIAYLVGQALLDDATRLKFVGVALASLSSLKQKTDSVIASYLLENYNNFTVLKSEETNQAQAERIGNLFADSFIIVPSLNQLGPQVRNSFISRNLYQITYENLVIAINNKAKTAALNVLKGTNQTVYSYMLSHLDIYLKAIDGMSWTIDDTEYFIPIIEDILAKKISILNDVIARASTNCIIEDISLVSTDAWHILAQNCRFPATFNNIRCYIEKFDLVDSALAKVLTSTHIISEVDSAEDSKITMALAILVARENLPSPGLRVELVRSLNLTHYLLPHGVEPESGELFALLLTYNIIEDCPESYERISTADWPTKMAFIQSSEKFADYMTPELILPDLAELLESDVIAQTIKERISAQVELYVDDASLKGLNELARFAVEHGQSYQPSLLQKMAQKGVPALHIVVLLEPHLASISRTLLFSILNLLDGDYPQLTEVGYDKPRIPNTQANLRLLERLNLEGIVGKYDESESPVKVNKKYK